MNDAHDSPLVALALYRANDDVAILSFATWHR
jgi:hypothetical protein